MLEGAVGNEEVEDSELCVAARQGKQKEAKDGSVVTSSADLSKAAAGAVNLGSCRSQDEEAPQEGKAKKRKKEQEPLIAVETTDIADEAGAVEGRAATEACEEDLRIKKNKKKRNKARVEAADADGTQEEVQADVNADPAEADEVKPRKKRKNDRQKAVGEECPDTSEVAEHEEQVAWTGDTEHRKKKKRRKDVHHSTEEVVASSNGKAEEDKVVEEKEEANDSGPPKKRKREKKEKDADVDRGSPQETERNGESVVGDQAEASDTKKTRMKKEKAAEEMENRDGDDDEAEKKETEEEAACVKVCVANLPTSMGKGHIWKMFEPCGEIQDVFLLKDWWTGGSRGVCFITFSDAQGSHAALKQNGKEHLGQELRVNLALDRQQGKGAEKGTGGSKGCSKGKGKGKDKGKGKAPAVFALGDKPAGCVGVIIKGLSYAATEEDLKQCFAKCGDGPTRVRLLVDSWGESKGKAFLDFGNQAAVDEAIKLTGTKLKGRKLCVDYSRPRDGQPQ